MMYLKDIPGSRQTGRAQISGLARPHVISPLIVFEDCLLGESKMADMVCDYLN